MKDRIRDFYAVFTNNTYIKVEAIWRTDAAIYVDTLYQLEENVRIFSAGEFRLIQKEATREQRFTERKEHARTSN